MIMRMPLLAVQSMVMVMKENQSLHAARYVSGLFKMLLVPSTTADTTSNHYKYSMELPGTIEMI